MPHISSNQSLYKSGLSLTTFPPLSTDSLHFSNPSLLPRAPCESVFLVRAPLLPPYLIVRARSTFPLTKCVHKPMVHLATFAVFYIFHPTSPQKTPLQFSPLAPSPHIQSASPSRLPSPYPPIPDSQYVCPCCFYFP